MMVGLATGLLSVTVWAGAAGASPVATSTAKTTSQPTAAKAAMAFHGSDYRHRGDRGPDWRREPHGHFPGRRFGHGR
jgi:hypothetical protein